MSSKVMNLYLPVMTETFYANFTGMALHHRIISARQQKGLTQEELADLSGLSVRTIQRIENGESVPRIYTRRVIADALGIQYEDLVKIETPIPEAAAQQCPSNDKHFLQLFNLSCFTYLVIPWVHFMIPSYLLKKQDNLQKETVELSQKLLRQQIYWVVMFHIALLLTLAYNLIRVYAFDNRDNPVSYLWPFLFMYFLNAVIIFINASRIGRKIQPVGFQ
jgi:transcriptional regulator with XRE-family HTH domain